MLMRREREKPVQREVWAVERMELLPEEVASAPASKRGAPDDFLLLHRHQDFVSSASVDARASWLHRESLAAASQMRPVVDAPTQSFVLLRLSQTHPPDRDPTSGHQHPLHLCSVLTLHAT